MWIPVGMLGTLWPEVSDRPAGSTTGSCTLQGLFQDAQATGTVAPASTAVLASYSACKLCCTSEAQSGMGKDAPQWVTYKALDSTVI